MTRSIKATKKIIEVGKKHMLDQGRRIQRHKIVDCQTRTRRRSRRRCEGASIARSMEQTLARMQAEYAAAQERLAQATVDEPSDPKVERDTPTGGLLSAAVRLK